MLPPSFTVKPIPIRANIEDPKGLIAPTQLEWLTDRKLRRELSALPPQHPAKVKRQKQLILKGTAPILDSEGRPLDVNQNTRVPQLIKVKRVVDTKTVARKRGKKP